MDHVSDNQSSGDDRLRFGRSNVDANGQDLRISDEDSFRGSDELSALFRNAVFTTLASGSLPVAQTVNARLRASTVTETSSSGSVLLGLSYNYNLNSDATKNKNNGNLWQQTIARATPVRGRRRVATRN